VTSNVQILNPATGQYEYIGSQYYYFTTPHGLNIMSFGVLYDFTGNSNASKITKGADLVKESWFLAAINDPRPIDLYLVIGHNPVRGSSSTMKLIFNTIRALKPDTPIQFFGGHTHIRDFAVYDNKSTALESGRYCETLGWLSISGIKSATYTGNPFPHGLAHASTPAVPKTVTGPVSTTPSTLLYSRRYLDWNRNTFTYHSINDSSASSFDLHSGLRVTSDITAARKALNLTAIYGCAPRTYCQYCKPQDDPGSIYPLLQTALATVVVNQTRATIPRIILINSGSVRFDLVEGPFTFDDSFIVSPFTDAFQYIPNVPWAQASQVLGILNAGAFQKRSEAPQASLDELFGRETCLDPPITHDTLSVNRRSYAGGRVVKRQSVVTPGYTTTDDFGTDGDDTIHSSIPDFFVTNDIQANASFPATGNPTVVDVIFLDFIAPNVIAALAKAGASYTTADVSYYLPPTFTTNSYLPAYAKVAWQAGVPNCPVGAGVGSKKA
jgi:hypothetical protein